MLSEKVKFVQCLAPLADVFDGDPAGLGVNTKLYEKVLFHLNKGAGATGTATITVEKCSDSAGTGATAIAFKYRKSTTNDTFGDLTAVSASGVATTAGASQQYLIEVDGRDTDDTLPFVRVQLTEVVDDPCTGSLIAICYEPRYIQANMPTALT